MDSKSSGVEGCENPAQLPGGNVSPENWEDAGNVEKKDSGGFSEDPTWGDRQGKRHENKNVEVCWTAKKGGKSSK